MTKKKIGAKEGRPTIVTPEVVAKLENAFAQGFTDTDACILADISRDCLYDYIKRVPSFATKREALRRRPFLSSVLGINKLIKAEDPTTLRWYAERKGKDEFSIRQESTGKDGGAIEHKISVTQEELREMAKLMRQT
jgi:hypothetical protein